MIVVDSSALIAIFYDEAAPERVVSTVTILETSMVLFRKRGAGALNDLHELMRELDLQAIEFDENQAFLDSTIPDFAL